jgi:hypothetical protein
MKTLKIIIFGLLITTKVLGQNTDFSSKWTDSIKTTEGFKEVSTSTFENFDLSELISNQIRFSNDPISSYTGVFGPNFRRIDFHLKLEKSQGKYSVSGFSKLGENMRPLTGEMELTTLLLRKQEYITDSLFIGIFKYQLKEPGDRDGDGTFQGTFALVFFKDDDSLQFFKTSSGDEPNFTNTFVGTWKRNNSTTERKVIFSFHPAGLYEKLPYCNTFYENRDENDDFYYINEKYLNFDWSDFDYNGNKSIWWKK